MLAGLTHVHADYDMNHVHKRHSQVERTCYIPNNYMIKKTKELSELLLFKVRLICLVNGHYKVIPDNQVFCKTMQFYLYASTRSMLWQMNRVYWLKLIILISIHKLLFLHSLCLDLCRCLRKKK